MSEPLYAQAFLRSWKLVRHNKILWIFGLLSIPVAYVGLSNFVGQLSLAVGQKGSWPVVPNGLNALLNGRGVAALVWLLVIMVAVGILTTLMVVASHGALIAGAAEGYKKKEVINVSKAWHKGVKHFWRLFGLLILRKIFLALLICGMGLALTPLLSHDGGWNSVLTLVVLLVGFLCALVISAVVMYTAGFVVEDEKPLGVALRRGWNMLSNHLLVSLEMSILLMLVDVFLIMILVLSSVLLLLPFVVGAVVTGVTSYSIFTIIGAKLSVLLTLVVGAFVGGMYTAFTTSAWVYVFMKMKKEGVMSKLFHWFGKLAR